MRSAALNLSYSMVGRLGGSRPNPDKNSGGRGSVEVVERRKMEISL